MPAITATLAIMIPLLAKLNEALSPRLVAPIVVKVYDLVAWVTTQADSKKASRRKRMVGWANGVRCRSEYWVLHLYPRVETPRMFSRHRPAIIDSRQT